MIVFRALFAAILLGFLTQTASAREMTEGSIVVLRTIDKLSARTHTFEIPVDKTVKFGRSLYIKVRACRESSPLDQPENAAFLQIWERKSLEEKAEWIFSGWMFSSNPSLSAMNHSVYDVWVIDCKNNATSAKVENFSSEKAPEETPAATPSETTPPAETATEEEVAEEIVEEPVPDSSLIPSEEAVKSETPEVKPPAPAPKLEEMPSSFEETAE